MSFQVTESDGTSPLNQVSLPILLRVKLKDQEVEWNMRIISCQGHARMHHTQRLSGWFTRLYKLCKPVPSLQIMLIWCQRLEFQAQLLAAVPSWSTTAPWYLFFWSSRGQIKSSLKENRHMWIYCYSLQLLPYLTIDILLHTACTQLSWLIGHKNDIKEAFLILATYLHWKSLQHPLPSHANQLVTTDQT